MKMRVKQFSLAVILMVLFCLGVAGAHAQDNRPRLRVINASLGAKNVDVYVGETLYFKNVHYGFVSDYVPVDARELELKVRPAGVRPVDPLTSLRFPFEAERDYTMVVLGSPEKTDRQPWMLTDDNTSQLAPGTTRVRFVHASMNSPGIEMCVDDRCEIIAEREVSRGDANGYIILDAGPHKITLRQIDAKELRFDVLPIVFNSGEVYSIFVLDPKQGEVRPRIIPQSDTSYFPPGIPGKPPGSWLPPGGPPGQPPIYPPVTGAFLSPVTLIVLGVVSTVFLGGGGWLIWRRLLKA